MKRIVCAVVLVAIACGVWGAGSLERSDLLEAWEDTDWNQAGWKGLDWTDTTPAKVHRNIRSGAEVNAVDDFFGLTVFMYAAAFTENHRIITTMIGAEADLGANDARFTPLMMTSAHNGNPQIIMALTNAGADLEAVDDGYGYTPLMFAVLYNDNPAVITALLDASAEVNNDFHGETALDIAYDVGKDKFVTLLEQSGSLVNLEHPEKRSRIVTP